MGRRVKFKAQTSYNSPKLVRYAGFQSFLFLSLKVVTLLPHGTLTSFVPNVAVLFLVFPFPIKKSLSQIFV